MVIHDRNYTHMHIITQHDMSVICKLSSLSEGIVLFFGVMHNYQELIVAIVETSATTSAIT